MYPISNNYLYNIKTRQINKKEKNKLLMELKNHETLSEQVYKSLKKSILNGDLEPGQKLSQDWLAQKMKVSRMPVREAIERLKSEGLIENIPYKESRVINFTYQDIEEMYSVRGLLEAYSARLSASKIREKDLKALKIINKEMKEHLDKEKFKQLPILNKKFHQSIYNRSGNRRLYKTIKNLWDSFPKDFFWNFPERAKNSIIDHEKIINAIESKNGKLMEKMMIQHIENTKGRLIKIIAKVKHLPLS
jgi:DNA-binding GntR family transcriptional regulator